MNRDDMELASQDQSRSGAELAHEVAMGSLPTEILAGAAPPMMVYDVQATVDKAVSRATKSLRAWNRKVLHIACKAARPAVEQGLRQAGKAFTSDEVRAAVRIAVKAYVDKYNIILPTGTILGGNNLEAVAAEICGAFSLPWTAVVAPQYTMALQAAKLGNPQAKSWLKSLFGRKKAAPAAPTVVVVQQPAPAAAAPVAAAPAAPTEGATPAPVAPAMATIETGSSDSLGDDAGAWMHKLNPAYWLKSSQEKKFIDAEKQAWIDNAYNLKQQQKKEQVMTSATKALEAKQASAAAYQRTAELEAQLKAIETQISGACVGSNVGKSEILGSDIGKSEILGADKSEDELEDPFSAKIPAEAAAPVLRKVAKARQLNEANASDLKNICLKLQGQQGLTPDESSKLLILIARNEQLHEFRKGLVSGELYVGNPAHNMIRRHVVMGAVKALTPTEQQQMAAMIKMAKAGNPNAQKALLLLQKEGYAIMGGWGFTDAVKLAAMPITVPTKYAWQATKAVGRAIGIGKKGSASPEQIRLQRFQASQKRIAAAQARARAADAQTEAEYRAQNQLAAAADAEAAAAESEANAKEAAMQSAEAQYMPGQTADSDPDADQSGISATPPGVAADVFLNAPYAYAGVKPTVTALPATPVVSPEGAKIQAVKKALIAKKNPKAAKIIAKSEENSPGGMKLRAATKLYTGAKRNSKGKEAQAIRMMAAKANKGDKQALADIHAVKLAQTAVLADQKAGKQTAVLFARKARKDKIAAIRTRAEVAVSTKLIENSRKNELAKVAKLERKAAAGNPKAVAVVKAQVAKAKAGDPSAKKVVTGLLLAKHVRTTAPTARDRANLRQAHKLVARVDKGDKRAIAQARMIKAAAKYGNPNAQRAYARLQTTAAVHTAIKKGIIIMPAMVVTAEVVKKKQAANNKKIASVQTKIAKGTASREEAIAAAKAAANNGDRAKAGELVAAAGALPSAKESLTKAATVIAASENGNEKAKASIVKATELAKAGDDTGIEAMGKVAAVKSLDAVAKGKAIDPEMKVAVQTLAAAQSGDEKAVETIKVAQERAHGGDRKAIELTIAITGAVLASRALANNETAHEEWLAKNGVKADTAVEKQNVDLSPRTPETLAIEPLQPIKSFGRLIVESLKALTFTTRHPFANYREGLVARRERLELADIAVAGDDKPPVNDSDAALDKMKSLAKTPDFKQYIEEIKKLSGKDRQDKAAYVLSSLEAAQVAARTASAGDSNEPTEFSENYPSIYSAGPLLPERYSEIVSRAKKGDAKAQRALNEIKAKGIDKKLADWLRNNPASTASVSSGLFGKSDKEKAQEANKAMSDELVRVQAIWKKALDSEISNNVPKYRERRAAAAKYDPMIKAATDKGNKAEVLRLLTTKINEAAANASARATVEDMSGHVKKGSKAEADVSAIDEALAPGIDAAIAARVIKTTTSGDDTGRSRINDANARRYNIQHPNSSSHGESTNLNEIEAHKKLADDTRNRLLALKSAAAKGDKNAAAKWDTAKKNYSKAKAKAATGDVKAKDLLSILDSTKLFDQ